MHPGFDDSTWKEGQSGFGVRVAAALNASIEAGLQQVAEECVKQCPTGALVKV